MKLNTGLNKKACDTMVEALRNLLASTYGLYLKTQNYHWNVKGVHFASLHLLFEKQYDEMAEAVDEIAERIRSLGELVDGTFTDFKKRSCITETAPSLPWEKMIKELLDGHEAIICYARPFIAKGQELKDDVTSDLIIRRLTFHEKAAWMLRSYL